MYFSFLDGLRGWAAIAVVLFHCGHWLQIPWLASNSYLAVDFFFCLSVFVLSAAYNNPKHNDLTFVGFARIRLIRLMPMMVLATCISAAYVLCKLLRTGGDLSSLSRSFVLGLVCWPDPNAPAEIGGPQIFPLNGPQYTLMLEIIVNLLWFPLRRFHPVATALCLSALCFVALCFTGLGGDTGATMWSGLPRVGASFFAGIALSYAAEIVPVGWSHRLHGPAILGLMAGVFLCPAPLGLPIALLWSACIVPVIILVGAHVPVSGSIKRTATYIGALSYPLYALHYPIFCWVNGAFQALSHRKSALIETPVILVVVVVGSGLALKHIDGPLRRILLNRRRSVQGSGSAARLGNAATKA